MKPRVLLASSSPRRIQLLKQAGFQLKIVKPNVDEALVRGESPAQMVRRLSRLKAQAVLNQAQNFSGHLIAADTTVVLNQNKILGKPQNFRDAQRMLRLLAGRDHEVLTGFTVLHLQKGHVINQHTQLVRSRVWIRALSRAEILGYVKTGEPMDKAGAYAAQGIGMGLVEKIVGSYTNVVGLPVSQVLGVVQKWSR